MQKRNKLKKAGIALLIVVTCCLLFYVWTGTHRYTLAGDFPRDKIRVFRNFIRYSAPHPIVDARLGLNDKVCYADFLSAVSLALSMQENYRWPRASFFARKILEPLAHDLKTKEFRGYRFPVEDLSAFFRGHAADVQEAWRLMRAGWDGFAFPNPSAICMARHYAQTFCHVHKGNLIGAYGILLRCRRTVPIHLSDLRFDRPHYFHSDEERHQWFLFLQVELRYFGHDTFADMIMEVELDHYRELIVWQLQKRAYMAQRLYEIRDSSSLSFFKSLLIQELADLRRNDILNLNFKKALDALQAIDDKVLVEPKANAFKGIIILPWINRQAIDRRMGIRESMFSERDIQRGQWLSEQRLARRITWEMERESIYYETKEEMVEVQEWILFYIRALAIVNERLYVEESLKEMTQLHSALVNNRNVSYTEADVHSDIHSLHRGLNIEGTDQQSRFDIQRLHIIVEGFWNYQFMRRQNNDMTVGDIVLPWVEVQNEWLEVNN